MNYLILPKVFYARKRGNSTSIFRLRRHISGTRIETRREYGTSDYVRVRPTYTLPIHKIAQKGIDYKKRLSDDFCDYR